MLGILKQASFFRFDDDPKDIQQDFEPIEGFVARFVENSKPVRVYTQTVMTFEPAFSL